MRNLLKYTYSLPLLFAFFMLMVFTNVNAQPEFDNICATPETSKTKIDDLDCEPEPNGTIQIYWDIDTYKPMMDYILLHNSPIKIIDVNFVII